MTAGFEPPVQMRESVQVVSETATMRASIQRGRGEIGKYMCNIFIQLPFHGSLLSGCFYEQCGLFGVGSRLELVEFVHAIGVRMEPKGQNENGGENHHASNYDKQDLGCKGPHDRLDDHNPFAITDSDDAFGMSRAAVFWKLRKGLFGQCS
jgi:hypothetical protein